MRTSVVVAAWAIGAACAVGAIAAETDPAHAAFQKGDYPRAIDAYERMGAQRRDVVQTLELARSYRMVQEPERAEALARAVLERSPKNTEALLVLGDTMASRGDWHGAAEQFAAATASPSARPEIWLQLGQALQMDGQPAAAELAFRAYGQLTAK